MPPAVFFVEAHQPFVRIAQALCTEEKFNLATVFKQPKDLRAILKALADCYYQKAKAESETVERQRLDRVRNAIRWILQMLNTNAHVGGADADPGVLVVAVTSAVEVLRVDCHLADQTDFDQIRALGARVGGENIMNTSFPEIGVGSLTIGEAASILKRMYESGKASGDSTNMIRLFGIMFSEQLKDLPLKDIATRATGKESYGGEIWKGMKLAPYVVVKSQP